MRFFRTWWRFLVAVQLLPALEGGEETLVGGQADFQCGVMMRLRTRGRLLVANLPARLHAQRAARAAFRKAQMDGLASDSRRSHPRSCHDAGLPGAQVSSANVALDEVQPEPAPDKKKLEISGWMAAVNIVISVGFFIFMYKFLPLLAATELKRVNPLFGEQILFNLVDGTQSGLHCSCCSSGVFLLWSDIHRVYEHHGAEHKTVYALENGDPLETAFRCRSIRPTIRGAAPAS